MNSILRRVINGLALSNVGSIGELRRRLDVAENSSPPEVKDASVAASNVPTATGVGYAALARVANQFTRSSAVISDRVSAALVRWLHLRNSAFNDDLIAGLTVEIGRASWRERV